MSRESGWFCFRKFKTSELLSKSFGGEKKKENKENKRRMKRRRKGKKNTHCSSNVFLQYSMTMILHRSSILVRKIISIIAIEQENRSI